MIAVDQNVDFNYALDKLEREEQQIQYEKAMEAFKEANKRRAVTPEILGIANMAVDGMEGLGAMNRKQVERDLGVLAAAKYSALADEEQKADMKVHTGALDNKHRKKIIENTLIEIANPDVLPGYEHVGPVIVNTCLLQQKNALDDVQVKGIVENLLDIVGKKPGDVSVSTRKMLANHGCSCN